MSAVSKTFRFLTTRFPFLRKALWSMLYDRFAKQINIPEWKFMNYGYAYPDNETPFALNAEDEGERYGFQLYEHMLRQIELKPGMKLLEVGSGRGGACFLMKKYFPFESCTGLDYSQPAVDFCHANYHTDGLNYVQGDAINLPFENDSFDVVINVESSHAYTSFPKFIAEVKRVLKPGGKFLITDSRLADEIEKFRTDLLHSGLTLVSEKDITSQVVKALELDSNRRRTLIDKYVPGWYRNYFHEFAGTTGTHTFNNYFTRKRIYLSFVFQR
jgi:ubiquinone/menaquinone biosynthesis C-methylase UbiE